MPGCGDRSGGDVEVGPLHPAFETEDALIPALYVARNSAQVGMSDACGYCGPNARLDQRGRRSCPAFEAVKHGQIELAEPLRVVEDVDLGDLPAPDREAHDRERLSFQ